MTRISYVESVIAEFCQAVGTEVGGFNAEGALSLSFDDLVVTFRYVGEPAEMLAFMVDIGEVGQDDIATSRLLLQLNGESWLGGGMTIGLDESQTRVIGLTALPVSHLERTSFEAVLDELLADAERVRGVLDRADQSEVADHHAELSEGHTPLPPSTMVRV